MSSTEAGRSGGQFGSFAVVTTLFFTWGFITSVIDPLIPSVRAIFHLSYAESMLTQFAFFLAYGVVSLPAARLVSRLGSSGAVIAALGVVFAGCVLMPAATFLDTYSVVLISLFVIAGGITILQVSANPLAAALGPPGQSHLRLTLSQAFNSLGTVAGPYFGSMLLLRGGVFTAGGDAQALRAHSLRQIDTSFFIVAGLVAVLTGFIFLVRRSLETPQPVQGGGPATDDRVLAALKSRWALAGGLAIFLYVGAEVSVGSMMINFLHQADVMGVSLEAAGKLLALYWLGAMVGRFAGSVLMIRIPAARLLMLVAVLAAALCLSVSRLTGPLSGWIALSIGLCNAIMFPTIFTLTLERSSASSAATSGLLCMSIVGGAILPPMTGLLADALGLHAAFLLPMAAYAVIALFAFNAVRTAVSRAASGHSVAH